MGERDGIERWVRMARASAVSRGRAVSFSVDVVVSEQRELARRCGARLLLAEDLEYPLQLGAISSPPPFLLVRGSIRKEDALAVAIVGARRATPYGIRVAERLASELAVRGVTIVSGFARGVDSAAHRGALAAGGRTIAVLGSGVDVIYPPENRRLVPRVLEQGALVSQFPMGASALPVHFPARNRSIAGLALGTIVVEAGERSGALMTAGFAAELGREVFAVPGPITSEASRGTHRLIQDGAKLVQGWEDVVAELPDIWRRCLVEPAPPHPPPPRPEGDEGRVLEVVGGDPVHIDRVIEASGVGSAQTAALLLALELKGLVRRLPGQCYIRQG